MRLGLCSVFACFTSIACSGADFAVAPGNPESDTGASPDAQTPDSSPTDARADVPTNLDSTPPPPFDSGPPTCTPVYESTAHVYVDAGAPAGGKGSNGCPFRTLVEAAAAPFGAIDRIVHVHAGTYTEASPIKVRPRETYQSDGTGLVKVIGGGSTPCALPPDSCTFQLDAASVLDGFLVEGSAVANGIVAYGTTGTPPVVKNTTVKGAAKDGIVVMGVGASFGPNTHADLNAWSGVMVRAGRLNVNGIGNGFDNNQGGKWIGSTYVHGSGIHVLASAGLFIDGGATANGNQNGIFFDAGGGPGDQTVSQVTATKNRSVGLFVTKGWKIAVRKSILNSNGMYGLSVSFDGTVNQLDLGPTTLSKGGNVFGTASVKNGKAGINFCHAPATGMQKAEGNTWGNCPPTQSQLANCDAVPGSYVDVAYASDSTDSIYLNPLGIPIACTTS